MRTTEQNSLYSDLDRMSAGELLRAINTEDRKVPEAIAGEIPVIERVVVAIVERMKRGGRVFYLGAGTSGRLGIVDASEIPPTYGVRDKFIGLMAGGDKAIRNAVEGAEDDSEQGRIFLPSVRRRTTPSSASRLPARLPMSWERSGEPGNTVS